MKINPNCKIIIACICIFFLSLIIIYSISNKSENDFRRYHQIHDNNKRVEQTLKELKQKSKKSGY